MEIGEMTTVTITMGMETTITEEGAINVVASNCDVFVYKNGILTNIINSGNTETVSILGSETCRLLGSEANTIAAKLEWFNSTKQLIKKALIDKGVFISDADTFRSYADKVASIEAGGGSGSIIRAYLPAEYSGSTEKGTKLLLNTKDYYVQETAEWEMEPITNSYRSLEGVMVGDDCMICAGTYDHYFIYRNDESEFVTSHTENSTIQVLFTPTSTDTLVRPVSNTSTTLYTFSRDGFDYKAIKNNNGIGVYGVTDLKYRILISKKGEEHIIHSLVPSIVGSVFCLSKYNLKDKEGGLTYSTFSSAQNFRAVGNWAIDPNEHVQILLLNTSSGELSEYYWDKTEHKGNGGATPKGVTLPTVLSGAFSYAVQFPTTLTINGNEVIYSFLYTGGDLYVYSFKESTMQWAEEPEIAQLIKDQLGTLSTDVQIQPQTDGSLYCTNKKKLCAFSFNSDGTITQVAHPCSKYADGIESLEQLSATVNKYAGTAVLCYRISTDPNNSNNYFYHFVYFKLEPHADTGELEWVAYDKKRSNYAVESMTGISTGVTGTTEDGLDYVECTVSLPE